MTLVQTTDHTTELKALLVQQFRDQVNIEGVLDSWATQIQELEDVLFALLNERAIDTAIGDQLDGLGAIVGETRQGRTDDEYRIAISVRLRINVSSGTPNQIMDIMEMVLRVATSYEQSGMAHFIVYGDEATTQARATEAAVILGSIHPAGVGTSLVYFLTDASTTFTMSDATYFGTDADLGFGDSSVPATGGYFAGVF